MKKLLASVAITAAGLGLGACNLTPHNPTAVYQLQSCPTDGTSFGYGTSCVVHGTTPHLGSLERIVTICGQPTLVTIHYDPFKNHPDCTGK